MNERYDAPLLKFLLLRENFLKYGKVINVKALTQEGKLIFQGLSKYYRTVLPEGKEVNFIDFIDWFKQVLHPKFTETQMDIYNFIFKDIQNTTDEVLPEIIIKLDEQYTWETIQEDSLKDGFSLAKARDLIQAHLQFAGQIDQDVYISGESEGLLDSLVRDHGVNWRLKCLQSSIGPLIKGDFGVIAGSVEAGKTAWLASEATHMAKQLAEGEQILWFNNEGADESVMLRLFQAAAGKTRNMVISDFEQTKNEYKDAVGDLKRILVYDVLGKGTSFIEQKCELHKPKIIIIDQLDNVKGETGTAEGMIYTRHLYQWARGLAKQYGIVLAMTQASTDTTWIEKETGKVRKQRYIRMHQLNFSKAEKQSTADFIITIGQDVDYPRTRYIHVPKNKLPGTGGDKYVEAPVLFNVEIQRYED